MKMETGHYHTAQHKYIKILACKDWNVTKNLTINTQNTCMATYV